MACLCHLMLVGKNMERKKTAIAWAFNKTWPCPIGLAWPQFWPQTKFWPGFKSWSGLKFVL